jgi:hypothetical protein
MAMPHSPIASPVLATALSQPRLYLWVGTTSLPPAAAPTASRTHPFIWSCVIEDQRGRTEQIGFLDTEGAVPARGFAETLLDALDSDGGIVVSISTAHAIRNELISGLPEFASRFEQVLGRLIEVTPTVGVGSHEVRERTLVGPRGDGMAAGLDLGIAAELEVMDDRGAQEAYRRLIDADRPASERRSIAWALFRYADRQTARLIREFARGTTVEQGGVYELVASTGDR